jgi:acetylornithine deacetylase/succinyl-diaminopimelate desuccinylase-like protein
VIDAHIDSVFPEETDLTIRVDEDGTVRAPGICDDARGMTTVLAVLKALQDHKIQTLGDLIFTGTVGEEELGDLRGIKAFFRDNPNVDGFIGVDGAHQGRVVGTATGSRRYIATFKSPGGHSWNAFGVPSAIHAMGRAVAKIADIQTPTEPKTTFTVGTVHGGSTVNTIAAEAKIGIDMRSFHNDEIDKLEAKILGLLDEAVVEENRRWDNPGGERGITLELKPVGNRPAGAQPEGAPIMEAALECLKLVGFEGKIWTAAASTNANVPIALGIPAVDVGVGGESGQEHTLNEWYRNTNAFIAVQHVTLLALGLAGMEGVSEPILGKRQS